jgi:organic radical activating enzyme
MPGVRTYQVKNIFGPTIQGEGLHQGMPCVFLRLAGCNAWDGRSETRASSACPYCDTDFRGGEALALAEIMRRLEAIARPGLGCVLTGGEPLLQADTDLLAALGERFPWVDIETNGTRVCPPRPATVFISCSPKAIRGQEIVVEPDWWKILIPDQEGFLARALASGKPVLLQPTCPDAGPEGAVFQAHLARCLELCYAHGCRLSTQIHKWIGVE